MHLSWIWSFIIFSVIMYLLLHPLFLFLCISDDIIPQTSQKSNNAIGRNSFASAFCRINIKNISTSQFIAIRVSYIMSNRPGYTSSKLKLIMPIFTQLERCWSNSSSNRQRAAMSIYANILDLTNWWYIIKFDILLG